MGVAVVVGANHQRFDVCGGCSRLDRNLDVANLLPVRSEGLPEEGSVFGYTDLAGIARGFGLAGKTFRSGSLNDLPKAISEFSASRGAAVWDFHVSDKVTSPTIRRAHPHPAKK